ncbi:MAG: hypothetical protein ACHQHM_00310 [Thermoanaerobaculales bacterium]
MIAAGFTYVLLALAGGWFFDRSAPRLASGLAVGGLLLAEAQLTFDALGIAWWAQPVALALLLIVGVAGLLTLARGRLTAFRPTTLPWLALAITLAAVVLLLVFPLSDWEARIQWAHKAQLLFRDGSALSESFSDPYQLHIHRRYPLLVPIQVAAGALVAGGWDGRIYQMLIAMAGLAAVTLMARCAGKIAALVLACTGAWFMAVSRGSIEVVLVVFTLAASAEGLAWLEHGSFADGQRCAVLLAGLVLVKNEGALLAVVLATALVVASIPVRAASERWRFAGSLTLSTLLLVPWLVVRARIPSVPDGLIELDAKSLVRGIHRLPEILGALGLQLTTWHAWNLVWWLGPLVLGAALWVKETGGRALALAAGLYVFGVAFAYVLSPWYVIDQHIAVTANRVLLPGAALLIAAAFRMLMPTKRRSAA